jgi:hypothetical protein
MITVRQLISSAAFSFFVATASAGAQGGTPDPERAAARQVVLAMASYVQDGKWAQADSLFATRGLHVLVDTLGLHSWAEYRDKYLKPDLAKYTNLKVAHTGVEAQVRGNVAWVAFRQEVSGTATPASPPRIGRGSAILEKVNDKWTVVHLHISR